MACLLVNDFAGNLVTYLTVPRLKPVNRLLEDLAADGELKLAFDANA